MARKYVVSEQICYCSPSLCENNRSYSKEFVSKIEAGQFYDALVRIANRYFMNDMVFVIIALRTYDMNVSDEYDRHPVETLRYWDNKEVCS